MFPAAPGRYPPLAAPAGDGGDGLQIAQQMQAAVALRQLLPGRSADERRRRKPRGAGRSPERTGLWSEKAGTGNFRHSGARNRDAETDDASTRLEVQRDISWLARIETSLLLKAGTGFPEAVNRADGRHRTGSSFANRIDGVRDYPRPETLCRVRRSFADHFQCRDRITIVRA